MRRCHPILIVTLTASVLLADRASAALPIPRPQIARTAEHLVRRLTTGLQRALPAVRIEPAHRSADALALQPCPAPRHSTPAPHPAFFAFQFRLPPPPIA